VSLLVRTVTVAQTAQATFLEIRRFCRQL